MVPGTFRHPFMVNYPGTLNKRSVHINLNQPRSNKQIISYINNNEIGLFHYTKLLNVLIA
jgi:hypothetical protein